MCAATNPKHRRRCVTQYLVDHVQAQSVCAGEFLSQVRRMENELSCKLAHVRCLRETMPSGLRTGAWRGGDISDPTGRNALCIAELQQEIDALYRQVHKKRSEISRVIRRLPNTRARSLMEMRYLSGLGWERIAESLCITPRSALRLHQKALHTVDVLLLEKQA